MRLMRGPFRPFVLSMTLTAMLAGCGEDLNKKGVAQLEARQYEAAAESFRSVLAKDKMNVAAIRNLVRANIELLNDSNLAETRDLIATLRVAKQEADAASLDKELEQKARGQALSGAPQFASYHLELFNTGEPAALPVILKSALQNPAGFEATFKAMRGDKKDALFLEALRGVTDFGPAAALTHIVWRNAPTPSNLRTNVLAQRRLAHDRKEGSLEAAVKAVAEFPETARIEFYRDVHFGAGDGTPLLATVSAYLEANYPAVFVEANIARVSVAKPSPQLLCSRRRVGAVKIVLSALEDNKPVAWEQIAEKSRASLQKSAGAYLEIVRKEAQEKPDRKFATGPVTDCLALFERLAQTVK